MSARFFKTTILPVLAVLAVAFGVQAFAAGDANIEKAIHDYIMKNPQVILQSVDEYQKKAMAEKQSGALEGSKDMIFNDKGSPEIGNPKGDIVIAEFFDYNCHYCKDFFPTMQKLLEKDKNIRFIFKDFPILGPTSETAAKWALAAQKQSKYFEFHKVIIQHKGPLDDSFLEATAKAAGMDVEMAKKDMMGAEVASQLDKNRTLASKLGLTGTPAFVIGDEIVSGGLPVEAMEAKIAEQRKKAGK